jgi:Fe-S cluster assembly ATP-binding protein
MNDTTPILEIKNLKAAINTNEILKNLNLKVYKGEIHAIMGPNGSGKSTFSKVLAGHPAYEVLDGEILLNGTSILNLDPEEISHLGVFLAFQYPIEIPGVSNEGFSGGEKKRNEILQMILLDSELSILDETDSGLDIDALKIISNGINTFMKEDKAIILITHYQRLLDYIKPTFVHVMQNGKIIKTGTAELAKELELKGYEWLK